MKYISIIKEKGINYFISASMSKIRKLVFVFFVSFLYATKDKKSFSQYSEDLFIDILLKYKETGSYIDVGANHPELINNTKKFYERGWTGVNIEPNYNNYKLFTVSRLRDLNINAGLGRIKGEMFFYNFQVDTLSTFSKEVADKLILDGHKIQEEIKVKILTLNDVFSMINKTRVDFVSIDTEGFNDSVLAGNDWNKNRARVICIEDESGHDYNIFFADKDYRKVCYNGLNSFFLDKRESGY